MGFQIVAAAVAAAGLLVGLIKAGVWLKDRYEERHVRAAPLDVLFLRAWTDARYYLVRLSIANATSIDKHVANCRFDVWAAPSPRWRQGLTKVWHRLTKRRRTLTRRGAVRAAGMQIDGQLRGLLGEFPDRLAPPFAVEASQAMTGTLAFRRFPWDGRTFEIIDLPGFFDTRDVTQALAARLVLEDDRGHKSELVVFVPWPRPPAAT